MSAAAFILPVFRVLNMALDLYWWVIIVMAVMSWLLAFDVINMRNDFVRSIWNGVNALDRAGAAADPPVPAADRRHGYFADRAAAAALLHPDGAERGRPGPDRLVDCMRRRRTILGGAGGRPRPFICA